MLTPDPSALNRILGTSLRQAINDPSRYTARRGSAADYQVEPLAEWAARACVQAIAKALLQNDLHLITGEQLREFIGDAP